MMEAIPGLKFSSVERHTLPALCNGFSREYKKEWMESFNRSPKGNTWSAIPVALLCMVVNRNERKGSGPGGDKVL